MTAQRNSRRRHDRSGEPAGPQRQAGVPAQEGDLDRQSSGRSISRVDFFRRMPTGSSTAYVKPAEQD
jgi:hypothetical protein